MAVQDLAMASWLEEGMDNAAERVLHGFLSAQLGDPLVSSSSFEYSLRAWWAVSIRSVTDRRHPIGHARNKAI
jgi:hypothetical protein